ncbi:hypothetical protein DFH11DRAFT_1807906, partial [Phellopilus nigrolimitatus]
MSETLVQRPTPIPHPPHSEVIDVDDFLSDDEVQIIHTRHQSLAERRQLPAHEDEPQEVIVLDDSDEEVQEVAGTSRVAVGGQNPRRRIRRDTPRIRRRLLFSPSPPPQDNIIPPVPPIPRHLPDRPLRWNDPPDFAGVFRPWDQPFAFEDNLPARVPTPNRNIPDNLPARGPPRRLPNMGLGGALLALNRQNQFEPAHMPVQAGAQAANANHPRWSIPGLGALRRWLSVDAWGGAGPEPGVITDEEDAALLDALAYRAADEYDHDDQPFRIRPRQNFGGRYMLREDALRHRDNIADYKQQFTHSAKPEPGFSNDFAQQDPIHISDEPGPSSFTSNEAGTILVCARCLDPLVMNVVGPEEVVRNSRLWALRCGHMFDGKCIDALMKPPPREQIVKETDDSVPLPDWKGKGKAKDVSTGIATSSPGERTFADQGGIAMDQSLPSKRDKGKRKASDVEEDEDGDTIPLSTIIQTDRKGKVLVSALSAPENSIRSRLRSRRPAHDSPSESAPEYLVSPETQSHTSLTPLAPVTTPGRSRRGGAARGRGGRSRGGGAKRKGRGRGKGKAKAAPVIEAEHEWLCPVAECRQNHKSILIDGVWRMDEERGAISMYV